MADRQRAVRYDKSGKPFDVSAGCPDDLSLLLEMYDCYSPRPASQGLPPADPALCSAWARRIFDGSLNFLAWRGERIIGHAALLPEPAKASCEFVIFVDQNNRGLGVGSELTALAISESTKARVSSIWLTVDATNHVAIRLYRKFGFTFTETGEYEHVMVLKTAPPGPL